MTTEQNLILVIEDDPEISDAIRIIAERRGHRVVQVGNGRDGLRRFFDEPADLVILDVGLPQMDGWTVLERIRELSDVAVLMLTAFDRESDKVRGLDAGADDYVTKPFGVRELEARIEALIRRSKLHALDTAPAQEVYRDSNVVVDWLAREVTVDGESIGLTPLEFQLLRVFVDHEGQALSIGQLLDHVWDDPYATGPDRVKFTVLRLRRKLNWSSPDDEHIESVRGYGYRYRRGAEQADPR